MVGGNREVAGKHYGHGVGDNLVDAAGYGEALGNDFIPMEEAGVVE